MNVKPLKFAELSQAARSILAGALIATGAIFSLTVAVYGPLVQGLCFSVGLFGVIACGGSLFTGGVLSVMELWGHRIVPARLYEQWTITYAFNLLGSLSVALMALACGYDASTVAITKAALPWSEIVVRGVLCNVMVCMAVYVARRSAKSTADVMAACLLPVACFVTCGWEHSIADMLYMPLGVMQGVVSVAECVRVILLATLGNVVGGIAFAWLVWIGMSGGERAYGS